MNMEGGLDLIYQIIHLLAIDLDRDVLMKLKRLIEKIKSFHNEENNYII